MTRAALIPLCFIALPLIAQDSCGGPPEVDWTPPGTDFAAPGPLDVTAAPGSLAAPSGCTLDYTLYQPAGARPRTWVVLSHGFQRSQEQMSDLAGHLASWGLGVATPDLCHSTPLDNDIPGDVDDLLALTDALGTSRVLYMGHSAGGMRSILAGVADPRALAVVGLDAVDALDYALDAAPALTIPLHGIVGEGSSCNADNNGIPIYEAAPDALAYRVTEADHCDFEGPTDALCTAFCQGSNAQFTEGTIHNGVVGLATSAALWRADLDASGAGWWRPGAATNQWLQDIGLVSPLVP